MTFAQPPHVTTPVGSPAGRVASPAPSPAVWSASGARSATTAARPSKMPPVPGSNSTLDTTEVIR